MNIKSAQYVKTIVNSSVDLALKKTQKPVMICKTGSWISGQKYNPVMHPFKKIRDKSDQDMTLLLDKTHSFEQSVKIWKEFKDNVAKNIKQHLEKDGITDKKSVDNILSTINVFPPFQVMTNFKSYRKYKKQVQEVFSLGSKEKDRGFWKIANKKILFNQIKKADFTYKNRSGDILQAKNKEIFTNNIDKIEITPLLRVYGAVELFKNASSNFLNGEFKTARKNFKRILNKSN